jgi:uncharacterized membrane protein
MSKHAPEPSPEHDPAGLPVDTAGDDHVGLERLVFFSDAVFAIAITLLALEIRLPHDIAYLVNEELTRALLHLWPKYLGFATSFIVIGAFWVAHHRKFRYIRRYDRGLLWLNLLLLMSVAFIPFPTAVLSDYGNRTATIFYALTMFTVGLLSAAVWRYATHRRRLVDAGLSPRLVKREQLKGITLAGVFLVSTGIALLDAHLAQFSWLILLVVYSIVLR